MRVILTHPSLPRKPGSTATFANDPLSYILYFPSVSSDKARWTPSACFGPKTTFEIQIRQARKLTPGQTEHFQKALVALRHFGAIGMHVTRALSHRRSTILDIPRLCAYNKPVMATMTIRTTVAFDPATAARLERLAKRWGISKSETLRRALEYAEMQASPLAGSPLPSEDEIAAMTPRDALAWLRTQQQKAPDFSGMTPLQILDWLRQHPSPPVPGGWGDDPHREMREMRERDAQIEDERERERCGSKVAEPGDPDGS